MNLESAAWGWFRQQFLLVVILMSQNLDVFLPASACEPQSSQVSCCIAVHSFLEKANLGVCLARQMNAKTDWLIPWDWKE